MRVKRPIGELCLGPPLRYARSVAETYKCDLLIVGGGLAGGLLALALAARRPELIVRIVDGDERIGGNHVWSFFGEDILPEHRALIEPLIAQAWPAYDVAFPGHARTLDQPYHSILSDGLDAAVRAAIPADRLHLGRRAIAVEPELALIDHGSRIEAGAVIDARGAGPLGLLDCGWQKFVGHELRLATPHGLDRPIVMDARVEQVDGYRFVYCLPFAPDRIFVEDTYYSESPVLDVELLDARIERYAARRGWAVKAIERRESGVLPVVMGGDFAGYWRATGPGVPKIGVRAGLFQPTTGYSLPDAVRTAHRIAGLRDLSVASLYAETRDHAFSAWKARGFYRLLDRMMFRAATPNERYRVLERFYRLDPGIIARFYAARSTMFDKLRILSGRPPVPVTRAIRALREGHA